MEGITSFPHKVAYKIELLKNKPVEKKTRYHLTVNHLFPNRLIFFTLTLLFICNSIQHTQASRANKVSCGGHSRREAILKVFVKDISRLPEIFRILQI